MDVKKCATFSTAWCVSAVELSVHALCHTVEKPVPILPFTTHSVAFTKSAAAAVNESSPRI